MEIKGKEITIDNYSSVSFKAIPSQIVSITFYCKLSFFEKIKLFFTKLKQKINGN